MAAWKQNLNKHNIVDWSLPSAFFLLGVIVYFVVYKNFPPYLTNDSGLEVLQARMFSPWPIKSFFHEYEQDVFESFYGYFMWPFLKIGGESLSVFKFAIGMVFAFTGVLFFIFLRRIFSLPVAILVAAAYITSAYTVWWPVLLSRNALSPLFAVLLMLGLLDIHEGKAKRGFWLIFIASFLGINTYSTFKVVVPAFLAAAFLAGYVTANKLFMRKIFITGITIVLAVTSFYLITKANKDFIMRGNYMIRGNDLDINRNFSTYALFFIRSFFLPIYQDLRGFLAEPTHLMFGRSMLNIYLYGIWVLGLGAVFYATFKKNVVAIIVIVTLLLSSATLCVGGPSLKTHLGLAPVEFVVVGYGINLLLQIPKLHKVMIVLLASLVLFVAYKESQHMFINVNKENVTGVDSVAQDVGLFLTKHNEDFDFAIFGYRGNDLMRMNYPDWKSKTSVAFNDESFNAALEQNKKLYKRIWLIMPIDSPLYTQLLEEKEFCYVQNIKDRQWTALLARCKDKTTPY